MSTEIPSENSADSQSLLDLIDPKRIAAIRAPGLDFQLHNERDTVEADIAREKWEMKKQSASAGIRMTNLMPPGPR